VGHSFVDCRRGRAICYAFLRAIGIYTAVLAKKTTQIALPLLAREQHPVGCDE